MTAQTIMLSYRLANSTQQAALSAAVGSADVPDSAYLADLETYIGLFNRSFELYGRQVRLTTYRGQSDYLVEAQGGDQQQAQADAATARQNGAFGDVTFWGYGYEPYWESLAAEHIISFSPLYMPQHWFEQYSPWEYSAAWPTGTNAANELGAIVLRRLAGMDAIFAGDPAFQGRRRVFGLADPDTPLYKGADVVVTTATGISRGGDDTVETVDVQGTRNLIAAAAQVGVGQFVYTSILTARPECIVPRVQSPPSDPHVRLRRARAYAERFLEASGMPYTVIAPHLFMESWIPAVVADPVVSGRPVRLIADGRARHGFVSRSDVAAFAVASARSPAVIGRRLPVCGPNAVCWRDVVSCFERALERSIDIELLPPGKPVEGVPQRLVDLLSWLESIETDVDMASIRSRVQRRADLSRRVHVFLRSSGVGAAVGTPDFGSVVLVAPLLSHTTARTPRSWRLVRKPTRI